MHHERRLQQMDQLLADLDVETRVRVLEHDVLLRLEQRFTVQGPAGARLRQRVDVGPFTGAAAAGRGVPLLAEGVVQRFVREELEEFLGLVGRFPGVLVSENVVLEMVFQDVEASTSEGKYSSVDF